MSLHEHFVGPTRPYHVFGQGCATSKGGISGAFGFGASTANAGLAAKTRARAASEGGKDRFMESPVIGDGRGRPLKSAARDDREKRPGRRPACRRGRTGGRAPSG